MHSVAPSPLDGLDLTSACTRLLERAGATGRPTGARWGAVFFQVRPGMSLLEAHQAYFRAAALERAAGAATRGR